jgi:hypothetical protein
MESTVLRPVTRKPQKAPPRGVRFANEHAGTRHSISQRVCKVIWRMPLIRSRLP